jgi:4-hydroxy-tetrahydrodipicolinate synthase
MAELKGVYVATTTAFDANGDFDAGLFRAHLDRLLEAGADGIVLCGGTGEFAYLSDDERREVIETGARHIDGRAGLIVNTSAIRDKTAVYWSQHAEGLGADALMILPPFFEGPGAPGVRAFYETVNAAVSTEIMLYNIPVHSGFDIDADLYQTLLNDLENVGSIKDSTGDMVRLLDLISRGGKVFNGCDPLAYFAMQSGVAGCVWGGANAMAQQSTELWALTKAGKLAEAQALWAKMQPANLHFWLNEYNPNVKAATNMRSGDVGACRTPAQPLNAEEQAALTAALAALD